MKFHEMQVKNNWEHLTFTIDGKKVKPGDHRIKWPDGTEEDVQLVLKEETRSYSDHGHEYSARSEVPYFEIDHHGAKLTLRADKAGCRFG